MLRRILAGITLLFLIPALVFSQADLMSSKGTIEGTVISKSTGDPLIGANVVVLGTTSGASTDVSGVFKITGIAPGKVTLRATYLGFVTQDFNIDMQAGQTVTQKFMLEEEVLAGSELLVIASRAKLRETPVAFFNVEKEEMQLRLGSRDVPMVLNVSPSVYATEQGGGSGDSRINIRGFNQRNVAVMINGVPVNDMENGWVYWSNWDGLGDVTSSIQVQRGLGASNLAISSVGGTMNILTDAAALKKGASFKQEVGDAGFIKSTMTASTGLMKNGFAASFAGVRKMGDGQVEEAWTDAWSYFGALSYRLNDSHKFDLYAVGSPQKHGQRTDKHEMAVFDREFAKDHDVDDEDIADLDFVDMGIDYNSDWGRIDAPEDALKEYYNESTHDIRDGDILMERENFYHKPQVNFNWYWKVSDILHVTNIFYYSQGIGGGTGTYGDWTSKDDTGQVDFQKVYDGNIDNVDSTYSTAENRAKTILRNSVNQHKWYGWITTAKINVNEKVKLTTGLDYRYYVGEHWREVRNLIGGDYFVNSSNKNDPDQMKRLGDKIAYHNDGLTRWLGGFYQVEYKNGLISTYTNFASSMTGYKRKDYFRKKIGGELDETDWNYYPGWTLKGGVNYNLTEEINLFVNGGYISKAPIFDDVYHYDNSMFKNIINQKIKAVEIGSGWKSGDIAANLNLYYTKWEDRAWDVSSKDAEGNRYNYHLQGIDALHTGVEFDVAYKPIDLVDINAAISLGNWEWQNDVVARFSPEDNPDTSFVTYVYTEGLKVGDAAQTQFAFSMTFHPIEGAFVDWTVKSYFDHYAAFDPADRDDADDDAQPWKIPSYALMDIHAGYDLPFRLLQNMEMRPFLHIFNLLDTKYISDASDGKKHKSADASVFFGSPRKINAGLRITF
ncbi:MAG: hypothetical protein B6244_06940 [Candidatus Cloacimonetes bacterium 4572_55]|nr:MAG: hypothetical protein B6244_06940 [Candidatus Cloacimonetes bacterium 4572_55]